MLSCPLPLILASRSPRRKKLLRQIGLHFRIIPSGADETFQKEISPARNARNVALRKARDVAGRLKKGIVIGADTIVVLNRNILGKPVSSEDAKRMLRLLSGGKHCVYTGIALVDVRSKREWSAVERTFVKFRKLSSDEIDRYVASGSPMDKAGAYGIQDDYGAVFVEEVHGCFYNVVGFPLARFSLLLESAVQSLRKG
ncbi:MAG: Maf family protein [Bacteroidota bacterium]